VEHLQQEGERMQDCQAELAEYEPVPYTLTPLAEALLSATDPETAIP
jgi:hypothetical protein